MIRPMLCRTNEVISRVLSTKAVGYLSTQRSQISMKLLASLNASVLSVETGLYLMEWLWGENGELTSKV